MGQLTSHVRPSTVVQGMYLGDAVAVKLIETHGVSEGQLRQATKELKLLSRLRFPSIVRLLGHCYMPEGGEHSKKLALVMPMAERDLHGLVFGDEPQTLPISEVAQVGFSVAAALTYLHARGIFHRDVKPGNVLVMSGGQYVLADFGLAKIAQGSLRGTFRGTSSVGTAPRGTAGFMPPEGYDVSAEVTPAFDVFSLGMLLYSVATGKWPFDGMNEFQVMYAVAMHGERPDLEHLADTELGGLISRMWAHKPSDRPLLSEVAYTLHQIARAAGNAEAAGQAATGPAAMPDVAREPVPAMPAATEMSWAVNNSSASVLSAASSAAPAAPTATAAPPSLSGSTDQPAPVLGLWSTLPSPPVDDPELVAWMTDLGKLDDRARTAAMEISTRARSGHAACKKLVDAGVVDHLVAVMQSDEASDHATITSMGAIQQIVLQSSQFKPACVQAGVLPALARLLDSGDPDVQGATLMLAVTFARHSPDIAEQMVEAVGLLPKLVGLLSHWSTDVVERAATTLDSITHGPSKLCVALAKLDGALSALVNVLDKPAWECQAQAASVLWDVAKYKMDCRVMVVQAGAVEKLVPLLAHDNYIVVRKASGALLEVASGLNEHKQAIIDADALPMLKRNLSHHSEDVKGPTVGILLRLAQGSQSIREAIRECGVVPVLQQLARSDLGRTSLLASEVVQQLDPAHAPTLGRGSSGSDSATPGLSHALAANLLQDPRARDMLVRRGDVAALAREWSDARGSQLADLALMAKQMCAGLHFHRQAVVNAGLVPLMVNVVKESTNEPAAEACREALQHLLQSDDAQVAAVVKAGGLEALDLSMRSATARSGGAVPAAGAAAAEVPAPPAPNIEALVHRLSSTDDEHTSAITMVELLSLVQSSPEAMQQAEDAGLGELAMNKLGHGNGQVEEAAAALVGVMLG